MKHDETKGEITIRQTSQALEDFISQRFLDFLLYKILNFPK